MRTIKKIINSLVFLYSSVSLAQVDLRLGGSFGHTNTMTDQTKSENLNYLFTPVSTIADVVFYKERLGLGMRYNRIDTIKDYQTDTSNMNKQEVRSLNASSIKMDNTVLSPLLSYRFYDYSFASDLQYDKFKISNVKCKTFADITLTAGKSDRFQLLMIDEDGLEKIYNSRDVWNYSLGLTAGFQVLSVQFALEVGSRRIDISHTTTSEQPNSEESFRLSYPYATATLGFGF